MKYEKPEAAVIDFAALQRIAYIPANNGEKTAETGEPPTTSWVGGDGGVGERD